MIIANEKAPYQAFHVIRRLLSKVRYSIIIYLGYKVQSGLEDLPLLPDLFFIYYSL